MKIIHGREHVPTDGGDAFHSAYLENACPWSHDEAPLERCLWIARWNRANYIAFWSHVHGKMAPDSVKNLERDAK